MTIRIVDLTDKIDMTTPVWPGFPPVSIESLLTMAHDGVNVAKVSFATHVGTHLDAPYHMIGSASPVDAIPAHLLIGDCVLLDATQTPPKTEIRTETVLLDDVKPSDIVILRTRRDDVSRELTSYNFPDLQLGRRLLEKKVKLYCTDAPGVDDPASSEFPFHKLLLASGVPIVEGLVNLASLSTRRFLLVALPLRLAGLDGSPCRVVAIEGMTVSGRWPTHPNE